MIEKVAKEGLHAYCVATVGTAFDICFQMTSEKMTDLRYSGRFLNITHFFKGLTAQSLSYLAGVQLVVCDGNSRLELLDKTKALELSG